MALSDTILQHFSGACSGACDFVDQYETLQDAWDDANRGDWMLFALGFLAGEPYSAARRLLTRLVAQVAKLSVAHATNVQLATEAVDFAEAWGFGDTSKTEDEIVAFMERMEGTESDELEDVFLVPLYVITEENVESLAADMANMASMYAGLQMNSFSIDGFDNDKLGEVADLVRSHFPHVPDEPS